MAEPEAADSDELYLGPAILAHRNFNGVHWVAAHKDERACAGYARLEAEAIRKCIEAPPLVRMSKIEGGHASFSGWKC